MGLAFFDKNKDPAVIEHLFVSGRNGGVHESKIYIRNDDPARYYTNISVVVTGSTYDALGPLGESGFSFKLMYGERQPTEAEWDQVKSGQAVLLPDIGTKDAADTYTYHPLWIRLYCPGGTPAQITDFSLDVSYYPRMVGN